MSFGGGGMVSADLVRRRQGREGLERQPRADRVGAVAEEAREVMALPRLVARDDERDARADPRIDERAVDGCDGEQGRDRRSRSLVRQEQQYGSSANRLLSFRAQPLARGRQSLVRLERRDQAQGRELLERRGKEEEALELAKAGRPSFVEEPRALPEERSQTHDRPLAQVVDRGIRHLGEALAEIAEERPRPAGEQRQCGVVAHGRGRLVRRGGRGAQQQ